MWPITTGRLFRADRRYRSIADIAGPAACPAQSRLTHSGSRALDFAVMHKVSCNTYVVEYCPRLGKAMRRRDFIAIIGNAAVGWPLAASAQEAGRPYRLGAVTGSPRDAPFAVAMFDELRRLGFIEGQNLTIDWRSYGSRVDLIPEFVAELCQSPCRCHLCRRGCRNSRGTAGDENDSDPCDYRRYGPVGNGGLDGPARWQYHGCEHLRGRT